MNKKSDNPHSIIELISKPKEWRMKASEILIKLWERSERIELIMKGILTLLIFVIGLLAKLVFLP